MIYRSTRAPDGVSASVIVRLTTAVVCCLALTSKSALCQEEDAKLERARELYQSIEWQVGPCTSQVGSVAEIKVPHGYQFTDASGAAIWAELTENPPDGRAGVLTLVDSPGSWFLTFTFDDIGYVPDDDKRDLDAEAILKSIQADTEAANELRRRNGWPELHVTGWIRPPMYDDATNNLEWAIHGRSERDEVANYNIRLLGRGGVMSVGLVITPAEEMEEYLPTVKGLLTQFQFKPEQKYAAFTSGDRIAAHGLTGLIVGGGTVAAAKTGLLAKLASFLAKGIKALLVGLAALAALAAGMSKALRGKGEQ